jgi:hypothetical protein
MPFLTYAQKMFNSAAGKSARRAGSLGASCGWDAPPKAGYLHTDTETPKSA